MTWHLRTVAAALALLLGLTLASAALARPAVDLWVVGGSKDDTWLGAVDARTIQRTGDIATADFMLLYRAPEDGADYTLSRHRFDCAARTFQILKMGHYNQAGDLVTMGEARGGPYAVPEGSVVAEEMGFICGGDRDHAHWEGVTVGQVVQELRLHWQQDLAPKAVIFDWWVIAGATDTYFAADALSVRRQGDKAWVKVIAARRVTGGDGFDYLMGEDVFDCAAGQWSGIAGAGFRLDGQFLGDFPGAVTPMEPLPDDALAKTEFAFACKGAREPAFRLGNYPAPSIAKGIRENWSAM